MRNTTKRLYCDATGTEIEDRYQTLTLKLRRSGQTLDESDSEIHLSKDAHDISYPRLVENDYVGYVTDDDTLAMIEESSTTRITYYSRDTTQPEMQALIEMVDSAVLNNTS